MRKPVTIIQIVDFQINSSPSKTMTCIFHPATSQFTTITKEYDTGGKARVMHKNGLGRTIEITDDADNDPYKTAYTWDSMGNLITLILDADGAAVTKSQSFDSIGQKRMIEDPDAGTWYFTYDDLGNLISHEDANHNVINYAYDNANRLIYEDCVSPGCPDGPEVMYYYDSPARKEGTQGYMPEAVVDSDGISPVEQNFTLGRLTSVVDTYTRNYYSYDRQGKQTTEARSVHADDIILDGTTPQIGDEANYYVSRVSYDDLGRVITQYYPDGKTTVTSEYGNNGSLSRIYGTIDGTEVEYIDNIRYDMGE